MTNKDYKNERRIITASAATGVADGARLLAKAVREGDLYQLERIIYQQEDLGNNLKLVVNARTGGSLDATLLHEAVRSGDWLVAEKLIACGARIDMIDAMGHTALHYAIEDENEALVDKLLKQGASVHRSTFADETCLHIAASRNSKDIVERLVNAGAPVDQTNTDLWTPLHIASRSARANIMDCLLKSGAGPNSRNKDNNSPLHLAVRTGGLAAIQKLLSFGADPNAANDTLITPLHIACDHNMTEVCAMLHQHGADPAALNKAGDTPLDLTGNRRIHEIFGSVQSDASLLARQGMGLRSKTKKSCLFPSIFQSSSFSGLTEDSLSSLKQSLTGSQSAKQVATGGMDAPPVHASVRARADVPQASVVPTVACSTSEAKEADPKPEFPPVNREVSKESVTSFKSSLKSSLRVSIPHGASQDSASTTSTPRSMPGSKPKKARFTAEHADNPSTIKMQDSTLNPGLDNNNYKDKRKNHDEHSVSLGQQQRNFAIGRNRSQSASFISDRARDTAADTTLDATQDSNSMLPSTFSNSQRRSCHVWPFESKPEDSQDKIGDPEYWNFKLRTPTSSYVHQRRQSLGVSLDAGSSPNARSPSAQVVASPFSRRGTRAVFEQVPSTHETLTSVGFTAAAEAEGASAAEAVVSKRSGRRARIWTGRRLTVGAPMRHRSSPVVVEHAGQGESEMLNWKLGPGLRVNMVSQARRHNDQVTSKSEEVAEQAVLSKQSDANSSKDEPDSLVRFSMESLRANHAHSARLKNRRSSTLTVNADSKDRRHAQPMAEIAPKKVQGRGDMLRMQGVTSARVTDFPWERQCLIGAPGEGVLDITLAERLRLMSLAELQSLKQTVFNQVHQ